MSRVFQILNGFCHWLTPYSSVEETIGKYPEDCLFVEAPDYVNEQWAYDASKEGDERFVKPTPPEGWMYDDETGTFVEIAMLPVILKESQDAKQEENKRLFSDYLKDHPVTWTDGKQYGITYEDQTEMNLNISQYKMLLEMGVENPPLMWHSCDRGCKDWTLEEIGQLSALISSVVYPIFILMNAYKEDIYECEDRAALKEINIVYDEDRIKWVQDGYDIKDYLDPSEITSNETTETTEDNASTVESTETEAPAN